MEVSYDLIKRFQFDLEMGRFKKDFKRHKSSILENDGVIKLVGRDDFLLITYILNYLGFEQPLSSIRSYLIADNFPMLILIDRNTKMYKFITSLSEHTALTADGIPSYLEGVKVELQ